MTTIDHYMVDYEDGDGVVRFANDVELTDVEVAKALAKAESKTHGSAAVVAYEPDVADFPFFKAVGHIMFSDGVQSDVDGIVA